MKRFFYSVCASLVLLGAFLSISKSSASAQQKPLPKASAIQVLMVQSDEIKLPAEFQVSLYENLIKQLEKKGGFQHVYRDGDSAAASVPDLLILHSTVRGFKQGSERARQVTTVAGATTIDVHCQFTGKDGATLLESDIKGKVRFFGANLKATYDFAKKAAKISHDNFSGNAGA